MKNIMTYAQALNFAIDSLDNEMVCERLVALRDSLAKRSSHSEESRAKAYAKRKAQNAENRAVMLSSVLPILRETIPSTKETAMTVKDIFAMCEERLPEDFTNGKVQYILLNDLPEVCKVVSKGKPNRYYIKN